MVTASGCVCCKSSGDVPIYILVDVAPSTMPHERRCERGMSIAPLPGLRIGSYCRPSLGPIPVGVFLTTSSVASRSKL